MVVERAQAEEWLKGQFEFEFCDECGGDAEHHQVGPVLGNPFAWCMYPMTNGEKYHPVIAEFRGEERP